MGTENFGFMGQALDFLFGFWGLILLIVIIFVIFYNRIISVKNKTKEAYAAIDTVLQMRYELIPNLVEIVKQYASHEKEIFNQVSEMRSKLVAAGNMSSKERFMEENALQAGLKSIFAIAENYPDLKASTNFLELQTQWTEIEDRLQAARRAYNAAVKSLYDMKEMFPTNIIAHMISIPEYSMFEADSFAKTAKMDAKSMFNS